jgi:ubiquinone/menaquinone biosynthesis C-methylase UbiE
MTVSIEATSKKYHGRKAATYETVRTKQKRWHRENELVEEFLQGKKLGRVLDIPVGTGRFLRLYNHMNATAVDGIDSSDEMLALAAKKLKRLHRAPLVALLKGDARKVARADRYYDTTVCVRFLDLIDEEAMRTVVKELCRVTKNQIVLTIRFGPKYLPKSNTAEHDERKFKALISKQGWHIARAEPIRDAGWHVLSLERK